MSLPLTSENLRAIYSIVEWLIDLKNRFHLTVEG